MDEWLRWRPNRPPFFLDMDRDFFGDPNNAGYFTTIRSWNKAYQAEDFCGPRDNRLHLGLLPQPFFGDLQNANIYILMVNPGLGPHDYFGEHKVKEYRNALLRNLRQDFPESTTKFMFLDPRFSWHGGFQYWNAKLFEIIETVAINRGIPFAKARAWLGDRIASIELLPYHSATAPSAARILRLPSAKLARQFVGDLIHTRVARGEAIVLILRGVNKWGIPASPGVILYPSSLARSATLRTGSPGGDAILEFLVP